MEFNPWSAAGRLGSAGRCARRWRKWAARSETRSAASRLPGGLDEREPWRESSSLMTTRTWCLPPDSAWKAPGTEGFQLPLKLRSREPEAEFAAYRHIPILMLTAIHTTTPLRFGPEQDYLPVDDFVDKPIDPDVLVKKVGALLQKR